MSWSATVSTACLVLFPILSLLAASRFLRLLIRHHLSPLRHLPGPPSPSLLTGNLAELQNTNLLATWERTYGSAFVYRGFLGGCRLMTTDPRAVAHPGGLLTVEGEQHKKQAPEFSSLSIRAITPVFWDKATLVSPHPFRKPPSDVIRSASSYGISGLRAADEHQHQPCRIDALAWLGRATLDVIGLAARIFSTARTFRVMTILQVWFPFLRRYRRNNAAIAQATETMRRIGLQLINERKEAVANHDIAKNRNHEHQPIMGRDLLSVLSGQLPNIAEPPLIPLPPKVRSNTTAIESQTMTTEEILCQISTVGSLRALAIAPSQRTLLSIPPSSPTLHDDVQRLPYLNRVVRESLRLHAPITQTMRVAAKDDLIPLSHRTGFPRTHIAVKKHGILSIPIQAINTSRAIWGADAQTFSDGERARAVPGLYSNTLTFLNGTPLHGNRACIGYKFALPEITIFLYVLLRDIDPALVIEKRTNVVTRPFVKSEPHLGNQMPLYIRKATPSSSAPTAPSHYPTDASV
ncbi:cytochrome P450 [Heliocybe sulcata]|uniref:Cytochrome P450 n=1 Tax=Heliocybe sulcata TaxID=5364 RepID=A0A5C3N4E1_9AGAM|nr:cytochrome P450 [Heliocybe sulcata]